MVPSTASIREGANTHVVQMVDKVWYEWQLRTPSNKNSFAGGSISIQVDPTAPPNGAPPLLSVCDNPFRLSCTCGDGADVHSTVEL